MGSGAAGTREWSISTSSVRGGVANTGRSMTPANGVEFRGRSYKMNEVSAVRSAPETGKVLNVVLWVLQVALAAVFLMAGEAYSFISSKLVKEVIAYGGNISGLVPASVESKLRKRLHGEN